MRLIISFCLIVFFALPSWQQVCAQNAVLSSYTFDGGRAFGYVYYVTLTKEMTLRGHSSDWLKTFENPPLSARKAYKAADKVANQVVGQQEGFERSLTAITLKQVGLGWVWLVNFNWRQANGDTSEPENALQFVVLMDGTVVQPE
jgi:hypothetical protein